MTFSSNCDDVLDEHPIFGCAERLSRPSSSRRTSWVPPNPPPETSRAFVDAAVAFDEPVQRLGIELVLGDVAHKTRPLAARPFVGLGRVGGTPNDGSERILSFGDLKARNLTARRARSISACPPSTGRPSRKRRLPERCWGSRSSTLQYVENRIDPHPPTAAETDLDHAASASRSPRLLAPRRTGSFSRCLGDPPRGKTQHHCRGHMGRSRLLPPSEHLARRNPVTSRNFGHLRARRQRLLDNASLVLPRPTSPTLQPVKNFNPHRSKV